MKACTARYTTQTAPQNSKAIKAMPTHTIEFGWDSRNGSKRRFTKNANRMPKTVATISRKVMTKSVFDYAEAGGSRLSSMIANKMTTKMNAVTTNTGV
jgi:hypothetical protein